VRTLATCALLVAGVAACRSRVPPPPVETEGAAPYRHYCAACHGETGSGDGVATTFLTPPPPDLTRLAARRGGLFPTDYAAAVIDGRTLLPGHDDSVIPVWREILAREPCPDQGEVRDTILRITSYLHGIQRP